MRENKKIDLRSESGFTLMELIVVIGVIAILIAILLPQFNGYTDKANAVSAKSNAKTALTVASAFKTEKDAGGDKWSTADAQKAIYKGLGGTDTKAPDGITVVVGATSGVDITVKTSKGDLLFYTPLKMGTGQLGETSCGGDKTRCDALVAAGSVDKYDDKLV